MSKKSFDDKINFEMTREELHILNLAVINQIVECRFNLEFFEQHLKDDKGGDNSGRKEIEDGIRRTKAKIEDYNKLRSLINKALLT